MTALTRSMTKIFSMISMIRFFIFAFSGSQGVDSFISQKQFPTSTSLSMAVLGYEDYLDRVVSYEVTVPKPIGVVFGENPDPYFGLSVDDVSEGMNGGIAGLRVGDQLLAVNEKVVVGKNFDDVMGLLQNEPKNLDLLLYRGPARQLFTVLYNQLEEGESIYDDEDVYEDEGSEPVIMDESYESPVRIEVKEQKPLTPGDFVKAFGKLGSMMAETLTSPAEPKDSNDTPSSSQPKKKTGFFGIGGEAVQLDSEEARGYRREKIDPDADKPYED